MGAHYDNEGLLRIHSRVLQIALLASIASVDIQVAQTSVRLCNKNTCNIL